MNYSITVDDEQQAAIEKLVADRNNERVVDLTGAGATTPEPITAEQLIQGIIDDRLNPVVAEMKRALVEMQRPLGEILVQLPEAVQEELQSLLLQRAAEYGVDTGPIEGA